MLMVLLPLWLSPGARGVAAEPEVDKDPSGAPYAAGELLVTYEPETSRSGTGENKAGELSPSTRSITVLLPVPSLLRKVLTIRIALPPPCSDFL